MNFKYNGEIKNLTMFGYDFSSGECEVKDEHFSGKLQNIPEFEVVKAKAKKAKVKANDKNTTD